MREIDRGQLRAPARVIDLDLDRSYSEATIDVKRFATVWCLLRRSGVPAGVRFVDLEEVESVEVSKLKEFLGTTAISTTVEPIEAPRHTSFTVVICTRDRSEGLLRALESLARQSDPNFDVLVVDNSVDGDLVRTGISIGGLTVHCCHEPAPGLSRARNRGLSEVKSEYLAWIDDDEVADPDWIAWIKRGFASPSKPDAVSGVMLPAELETDAQVTFERYGGFNKGRGMQPEELRAGTPSVVDPLYPLPNFGAGGNLAFRSEALRAVGGFDPRLGAGTLTHGGDETRALSLILESGAAVLHWPPAVTWHYHRRTADELEKQFFGYSAGLTAYYMSMVITSPKYLWRILSLVPRGLQRILANGRVGGPEGPPAGFPEGLIHASRRGLYQGGWLYLREVLRQRRADRNNEYCNRASGH